MVDDMTFTKRGISFVSREDNGLAGGLDWMMERMRRSRQGSKMRQNGRWKTRQVRRYLRMVDRFREGLLFCVHVSAGQPARGTEILGLRHQNGFLQDRNVYVMDGRVVMITRYHKSQSQYDTPKIIPRFLPWRVGQLMAVYLGYVQRFMEHLTVQVQGLGWSDHVWANSKGPWETDRLTSIITEKTARRLGERLTTLDYRHAAISIGRVFVGEQFARGYREEIGEAEDAEEAEMEVSDPLELSAGRGEVMGEQRYGVPSDIVKHLSVRSMKTFRPLSEGGVAPVSRLGQRRGGGAAAALAGGRFWVRALNPKVIVIPAQQSPPPNAGAGAQRRRMGVVVHGQQGRLGAAARGADVVPGQQGCLGAAARGADVVPGQQGCLGAAAPGVDVVHGQQQRRLTRQVLSGRQSAGDAAPMAVGLQHPKKQASALDQLMRRRCREQCSRHWGRRKCHSDLQSRGLL